jgi:Fe-S cluster biogenesis protein NfuA
MAEHNHKNFSLEAQVNGLIEQLDAYISQYHGGTVDLVSFDGHILKVHLGGACEACDLQETTLKGWVEGTVKQFFPEIEKVERV